MAEVADDFVETLKAVRGEFQNSKGGRIGNRILAHIFSTLFPIIFLGYLVFWGKLQWSMSKENWLFLAFGLLTLFLGVVLHRSVNCRYVFDDEGVREFRQNGQLKNAILWKDLERINFLENRGIKSFILKTETKVLQVEYYQSLNEAIALVDAGRFE